MRIENIVIIALVAGLVYFGFLKKKSPATDVTVQRQLPPPQQLSEGDGGAARALIEQGIDTAGNLLGKLIDKAFDDSAENVAPQTSTNTF